MTIYKLCQNFSANPATHQVMALPHVQSPPSEDDPVIITTHSTPLPSAIKFTSQSTDNDVIDLTFSEIENEKPRVTNGSHSLQADAHPDVTTTDAHVNLEIPPDDRCFNGKEKKLSDQSIKLGKRKVIERDHECRSENGSETVPAHKLRKTDGDNECSPLNAPASPVLQSSVEADNQRMKREEIEDEFDKLFSPQVIFDLESNTQQGQSSCGQQSVVNRTTLASEMTTSTPLAERLQPTVSNEEQEDAELQKAMEASMKEQVYILCAIHV